MQSEPLGGGLLRVYAKCIDGQRDTINKTKWSYSPVIFIANIVI